jgi:hypothetical protein
MHDGQLSLPLVVCINLSPSTIGISQHQTQTQVQLERHSSALDRIEFITASAL